MENQQETELFWKAPEIHWKYIERFDFWNGMYGNVTSLEHRESTEWKIWPIFEWF